MFSFIAFVVAAGIFLLRAFGVDVDSDWGLFCVAIGLALAVLPDEWPARVHRR